MKTALCITLLSAGLFGAQMIFAQSGCASLNMDCLAKQLSISDDLMGKVEAIQKDYSAQCSAAAAEKSTADQMATLLKQRNADISEALDVDGAKLDAALKACTPSVPARPTSPAPPSK